MSRLHWIRQATLLSSVVTLAACSANVSPPDSSDAESAESVHALLVVRQDTTETSSRQSEASLWFVRVANTDELQSAIGLVTEQPEIPTKGTCRELRREPDDSSVTLPETRVDLSYVGDVTLKSGDDDVPFSVRAFPDVANLVSGVVYTLRDRQDLPLPLQSPLSIVANSRADQPTVLTTTPPAYLQNIAFNQTPISSAIVLDKHEDISVTWSAAPSTDGLVYADVEALDRDTTIVRCAWSDHGEGLIPHEVLPPGAEQVKVTLHRTRRTQLRSEDGGIAGQARFDLSKAVVLRLADGI